MNVTESTVKDLELMGTYFGNIQAQKNTEASLRGIERILHRVFDLNVKINIVDNNTGKFFGMTVTPERMDRILMAILEERSTREKLYEVWREEKNWVIEIDDLLLYDKNLHANPREIVAVLLHEIGHVVYSNEAVSRANRVIKMTLLHTDAKYRRVITNTKFRPLLEIPLYESCATKHFRFPKDINREEYIADKFVMNYGYGNALISFIEKLIKTRGNSLIDRPSHDMDKDVEILVKWTIENVASLEFRKTKLKHSMKIEEQRNPSKIIKNIIVKARKSIFGPNDNKGLIDAVLQEQFLFDEFDRLTEKATVAAVDNRVRNVALLKQVNTHKRLKKIESKDIDILEVEVERIEYHDDKIYIIELIHQLDEKVLDYIELINTGRAEYVPQSKQSLMALHERLMELRASAMNTKIKDARYGLFVKYPDGYEG